MATESFYGGTRYPLESGYGDFIGYNVPFSELGTSVDARTANQIKEVSEHLNSGVKVVEVAAHSPEVFEAMPKDHLKELNRLAKLTGAELTMHAPMVDPTGITQNGWDKMNQDMAERQLWSAIERSHDLDPKGNINVTLHASTAQLPAAELKIKEEGKEKVKSVLLVTPDGRLHQVRETDRFLPEQGEKFTGKQIEFEKDKAINQENEKFWTRQLDSLNYNSSFASRNIKGLLEIPQQIKERKNQELNENIKQIDEGIELQRRMDQLSEEEVARAELAKQRLREKNEKEIQELIKLKNPDVQEEIPHIALYARNAYTHLKEMFDLAYKNAQGEDREKLADYAREITEVNIGKLSTSTDVDDVKRFVSLVDKGVATLSSLKQPKILTPLRDFAIEKSAETTANLAFKGYKKFKDSAPVISLENHPAQQSLLTTGQDLKDVVKAARKEFVKKAVKDGIDRDDAKEQAEKLIGATWDVGHINMLRRYGYSKKDIIKESEKIAPYVKHVHLSDNFGHEHTELPMGMGNVPIKEIMQKLGKEGFKGKKVAEALSWWQHFSPGNKVNPAIIPTMQAFGSPISSVTGAAGWNQYQGIMGGYFGGYGTINPEIHHSLYGAGFSTLPQELGGQISGKESRFSGTPMS